MIYRIFCSMDIFVFIQMRLVKLIIYSITRYYSTWLMNLLMGILSIEYLLAIFLTSLPIIALIAIAEAIAVIFFFYFVVFSLQVFWQHYHAISVFNQIFFKFNFDANWGIRPT